MDAGHGGKCAAGVTARRWGGRGITVPLRPAASGAAALVAGLAAVVVPRQLRAGARAAVA